MPPLAPSAAGELDLRARPAGLRGRAWPGGRRRRTRSRSPPAPPALHLALLVAGVERGDEVWSSDLTFIATANAADQCGARITLVDSEAESWNLDPEVVVDELNRRAKAGETQPEGDRPRPPARPPGRPRADRRRRAAARRARSSRTRPRRWAAPGRGGALDGRAPGTVGDFGIYSFNFNKVISTGGGGMVVARDAGDLARVRHLGSQAKVAGSDYVHDEIGFNYRLSNVAAALGAQQIARLPQLVEQRRAIAARYRDAFAPLGLASGPDLPWACRTGWLSSVILPDPETRAAVRNALERGRHRGPADLAAAAHPGPVPRRAGARW